MTELAVASPLPFLFDEDKIGDRQAREALFCTFNADLGYFERTVLGVTQSTGARVTIVGDARISDPDPRAARNAGTRYVHGLALPLSGSAFHPKVTVIAGPSRAVVAIGSGNLSPGGWHLNHETWTIATADQKRCPALVTEVAGWLRTLDSVCAVAPQALRGIERTASWLERLADGAEIFDSGHRLVHTNSTALIDQLPGGDIQQLLLYAPFHDERAAAVRRLIERLRPRHVTLAVQTGDSATVLQPAALQGVVDDLQVPFEVVADASERYRHGKLIEAVSADGSRWTLTGSPNLSAAALLLSAGSGGNIEVGVIARPDASLFPRSTSPTTLDEVPAVSIAGDGTRHAPSGATLLSAALTDDGLELVFARPIVAPTRVEASVGTDFDQWTDIGTVPAGVVSHVLSDVAFAGGTRVRCAGMDGVPGSVVFVTDPTLIMVRPGEHAGRGSADSPDPTALISDPHLLEHWASAYSELDNSASTALPRLGGPGVPRGEDSDKRGRGGLRLDTDEENWLAYTDSVKADLGAAMFHFVMGGFPALRTFTAMNGSGLLSPTDKVVDDSRPGLDTDDESVDDDAGTDDSVTPVSPPEEASVLTGLLPVDLTEYARKRVRRGLETKASKKDLAGKPAFHRLAVLTLVLCAIQAGIWESALGEQGWIRVVAEALKNLDKDDIPERLSARAASWAALAVYLMHEFRPTHAHTAEVIQYKTAADAVSHLFSAADVQLIADFAGPFTNRNGYPVDPDAVMYVIDIVVQDDPLTEAIDVLGTTRPAWQLHKHGNALLHVWGAVRATFLTAAEALDAIPGTGTAGVLATSATAAWTIVIRHDGTLIHIDKNPQGQVLWRHYRLGNLISSTGIARDPELASRIRIKYRRLNEPFPAAIQAAIQAAVIVGLDLSTDPPYRCPPMDN